MLGGKVSPPNLNLTWQSTAVYSSWASKGLMPLSNLAGLPLKIGDGVLAFEEDDVSVVFIYFSVGVASPKFLNFISSLIFLLLNIYDRFHKIIYL